MKSNIKYFVLLILIAIIVVLIVFKIKKKDKVTIDNPSIYFESLYDTKGKHLFRAVDLMMTKKNVLSNEKATLFEEPDNNLFYAYSFPVDSTPFGEYLDLKYFFNENNQLDIIMCNVYLNDSIQEDKMIKNLNQYYSYLYGRKEVDEFKYDVWNAHTTYQKEDVDFTVAIRKMQEEYGINIEYNIN
ncbi:MAG: hypothetical protein H6553_08260 [Chitinophagales bacterium]|nr:hypothetical protein [Chitinophagales bacterium]